MDERFKRIFTLPPRLYIPGSPIVIAAGALLVDNINNCLIAQLKFKSISNKLIKTVKVEISCFDSVKRPLDSVSYEYLDFNARRTQEFGSDRAIVLKNLATRSYKVKVLEVCFTDNTIWHEDGDWCSLPNQARIANTFSKFEKSMYESKFGLNADYLVSESSDLWFCTCGEINHECESNCHKCRASLQSLKNINREELRTEGTYRYALDLLQMNDTNSLVQARAHFNNLKDYRDSQKLIDDCDKKIAQIAKKKTMIKRISLIAACSVVFLVLLSVLALHPLIKNASGDYRTFINMYNIEEFKIPDGVTSISKEAFSNCESLKTVIIPDSVTSIEDYAFFECANLESVSFPNTVTSIGNFAFSGCSSLTSVSIPNSVKSIGISAFQECTSIASIIIPDSVKTIGDYAFLKCTGLKSVTIGHGTTRIGSSAFKDCSKLESAKIGDAVNYINEEAFANCQSLKSVDMPQGTKHIGARAFLDCKNLNSITISRDVINIGEFAFSGCTRLKEIYFNATVMNDLKSGSNIFDDAGTNGIGIKLTVGSNVYKIPAYLFYLSSYGGTIDLLTVNFEEDSACRAIGENAFASCEIKNLHINDLASWCQIKFKSGANPIGHAERIYLEGEIVTELVIPDGVTKIEDYAFSNFDSLTAVTIPNSVKSIGSHAFYYCKGLANVVIPNEVTDVGDYAFYQCSNITSLTIGTGLKSIGVSAFQYCSKLSEVYFNAIEMNDLKYNDYVFSYAGRDSYGINLVVGNNVKKIPGYLFYDSGYIKSVKFEEESVCTSIGQSAFAFCDTLYSVIIPVSVTSIGKNAFYSDNLTNIKYRGSKEQWSVIEKGDDAYMQYSCSITYNYSE